MLESTFVSPNSLPVIAATRSNVAMSDEQPVQPADDHEPEEEKVEIAHGVRAPECAVAFLSVEA